MIVTKLHDDVLEILIDNAPVNALGLDVRAGLMAAVTEAGADGRVKAIVIRGAGKLFCAGADIAEFGAPLVDPALPEVADAIEASAKPVIAAIHGAALGGGLEVALACHYRIATPDAQLGLPEVKLGLLPGAGGTQRLPRLVGAGPALDMIVLGDPIDAGRAVGLGLIDRLAEAAALAEAAIAYARELHSVRRTGDGTVAVDEAVFETFAAKNARAIAGFEAPAACIEAIKGAVQLPLAEGMALERALFDRLMVSAESQALRHIFFAERTAMKIEGLPRNVERRRIARVGIIGAGTMGAGISMNFLSAGFAVTLLDMAQEGLDRGAAAIRTNYEGSVAKGRITAEAGDAAVKLLSPTLDFEALRDCDLVIEAVYENMEVKKEIFARLDAIARPGAILASNTSYLDLDEIAAATARPHDVVGLHFFSPANIMKLVEVVRGAATAPDVIATAMQLARSIGKIPVVAGVCYGFIGNRMLIPRQDNAEALLLEGATPEQVDRVHTAFGMPMGPFQMADLAGVDIGWHRDPERIDSISDALCAQGRWGQKTKAGYYDYDDRRRPTPSAITDEIVSAFRTKAGIEPRAIEDDEIVVRTLYTMVNEAALILEEGIAQRASDIDVVWVYGYGWPRRTGGPVFWADKVGLSVIVAKLDHYADRLGSDFRLSSLLVDCATAGTRLDRAT
ncbi:3-hydroxyacyl-CoA dehydrogenase NAD-binding domain-containing protein [Sphingomonas sp. BIUV-7]|uniref:3-hydroxyacyl-CoA dehydrogenase NAD-binding domain-containing protein n=1 Tax=Sphingomonas natans TaxID=3063330 RepID=A0ABT8Y8Q4_9SPHN|nr:3-hydroxyacyl-CoA dehydrogenase NAD-binding domain-containing protein [Sphingomonas sp. BIUV-7]MDO6414060.1 3-hydroxyacyl-CoA dehydrogenase NAD-binding domain-containing protein [Sphingomonas sp. BIUV-7]